MKKKKSLAELLFDDDVNLKLIKEEDEEEGGDDIFGDEEESSDEEGEEGTEDLIDKFTNTKWREVVPLAFSAPVLAVSWDALFAGSGSYGPIAARQMNNPEVFKSVAIVSATLMATLAATDMGMTLLEKGSEGASERFDSVKMTAEKSSEMIKKAAAKVLGLNVDEIDKDTLGEEVIIRGVMALITSYGLRGLHNGLNFDGHDVGPVGITVESGIAALALIHIYGRSEKAQEIVGSIVEEVIDPIVEPVVETGSAVYKRTIDVANSSKSLVARLVTRTK